MVAELNPDKWARRRGIGPMARRSALVRELGGAGDSKPRSRRWERGGRKGAQAGRILLRLAA